MAITATLEAVAKSMIAGVLGFSHQKILGHSPPPKRKEVRPSQANGESFYIKLEACIAMCSSIHWNR